MKRYRSNSRASKRGFSTSAGHTHKANLRNFAVMRGGIRF